MLALTCTSLAINTVDPSPPNKQQPPPLGASSPFLEREETRDNSRERRGAGEREMGRAPCCDKANVKKGPWAPEEDVKLKEYIEKHGTGGNWISLPQKAGLRRCGKSCRLRWLNYLRPNIKHGEFSDDEDRIIYSLFASIGSRWSIIAAQLPGRTDNDIKNYWNTKLKKKLMGFIPQKLKSPNYPPTMPILHHHDQISSSYSSNNYFTPSSSITSTLMNTTTLSNNIPIFQSQNGYVGSNLLMFGGTDQASTCSSSEGTNGEAEMGGFQSYLSDDHENQKLIMASNGGGSNGYCEKSNGYFGENTIMDYSLEDIKQLISTNHVCSSLSFLNVDENKMEEKLMYY